MIVKAKWVSPKRLWNMQADQMMVSCVPHRWDVKLMESPLLLGLFDVVAWVYHFCILYKLRKDIQETTGFIHQNRVNVLKLDTGLFLHVIKSFELSSSEDLQKNGGRKVPHKRRTQWFIILCLHIWICLEAVKCCSILENRDFINMFIWIWYSLTIINWFWLWRSYYFIMVSKPQVHSRVKPNLRPPRHNQPKIEPSYMVVWCYIYYCN